MTGEKSKRTDDDNSSPVIREYVLKDIDGKHVVAILNALYPANADQNAYARFAFDSTRNVVIAIISEQNHNYIDKIVSRLDTPAVERRPPAITDTRETILESEQRKRRPEVLPSSAMHL